MRRRDAVIHPPHQGPDPAMLDIRWIRENPQALVDALVRRGWSADESRSVVDGVIVHDEARRSHLTALQQSQERRNAASKEIGNAMRAGDMARAEALKAEVGTIKEFIQNGEARERELDEALKQALAVLPNVPLPDVPVGRDEHANVELRRVGAPRRMDWAKEHWELGEAMGLMDFERAAKLSGARFTVLKGQLARLERALGQFMLDLHTTEHGYTEVQPPLMVRSDAMFGTGQLPKFKEDLFPTSRTVDWHEQYEDNIRQARRENARNPEGMAGAAIPIAAIQEDMWLIPTAEVPLTNMVREEHPLRRRPAPALHCPHALLPLRGRFGRARHARHAAPAPVLQGGAGVDHRRGEVARERARADDSSPPKACCRAPRAAIIAPS
jgi:seryl-tRNA synthetase